MQRKEHDQLRNKSLNIRGNPMFGKRVEQTKKGKRSYNRKAKYKDYLITLVSVIK